MYKKLTILIVLLSMFSCRNDNPEVTVEAKGVVSESSYPSDLQKIFDAHGGLEQWNSMGSLSFGMERPNGVETTITNLTSRHSLIETPTYKLGYNGQELWLKETDTIPYNGNAKFYNGLMFYFYAMPFVLADEGIVYEKAEPLTYDNTNYPGILISYNEGVGVSPDDQYIVYYDPESYQMTWLAYTVTFGKDEKSTNFRYIEYHSWQNIEGIKLPSAISWYKVIEGEPAEKRNTLEFIDVQVGSTKPDEALFQPEDNALIMK